MDLERKGEREGAERYIRVANVVLFAPRAKRGVAWRSGEDMVHAVPHTSKPKGQRQKAGRPETWRGVAWRGVAWRGVAATRPRDQGPNIVAR